MSDTFFGYIFRKIHIFLEQLFFSFHENKVLQLMSAGASLKNQERFGEKNLVFIK